MVLQDLLSHLCMVKFETKLLIPLLGIRWDSMRNKINLVSSAPKSTGLQLPNLSGATNLLTKSLTHNPSPVSYQDFTQLQILAWPAESSELLTQSLTVLLRVRLCFRYPQYQIHVMQHYITFISNIDLLLHCLDNFITCSSFHIKNCLRLY